jgi:hypothetical protein
MRSPKPASSNILPFPSKTEREEKSAHVETTARSLEVSPPGVRQILEMARHALLYCSDRVLVDAVERGAGPNCAQPVRLPLDFTEEIKAIDAALAELPE